MGLIRVGCGTCHFDSRTFSIVQNVRVFDFVRTLPIPQFHVPTEKLQPLDLDVRKKLKRGEKSKERLQPRVELKVLSDTIGSLGLCSEIGSELDFISLFYILVRD